MLATLRVRGHMAEVVISYTATSYSIQYKSSYNMRAEGNTIHKKYNSWIHNLERQIRSQVQIAGS